MTIDIDLDPTVPGDNVAHPADQQPIPAQPVKNEAVCQALESLICKLVGVGKTTPLTWNALVREVTLYLPDYIPPMGVARGKGGAKSSEEFTLALGVMVHNLQQLSRCPSVPAVTLTFSELGASEVSQLCPQVVWTRAAAAGKFCWSVCQTSIVIERASFTDWYLRRLHTIEMARREAVDRVYDQGLRSVDPTTTLAHDLTNQLRRVRDRMASAVFS
jgi:hypothetical protein